MRVFAIDPGCKQSAFLIYDTVDRRVIGKGIVPNRELLDMLTDPEGRPDDQCAIEMIQSFGMAVGAEVFETVFWIGRFAERWEASSGREAHRIFRKDIKVAMCGHSRAQDSNVRVAMMDRFGSEKAESIGTKRSPGPLFGITSHMWSALAVALTFSDKQSNTNEVT